MKSIVGFLFVILALVWRAFRHAPGHQTHLGLESLKNVPTKAHCDGRSRPSATCTVPREPGISQRTAGPDAGCDEGSQ